MNSHNGEGFDYKSLIKYAYEYMNKMKEKIQEKVQSKNSVVVPTIDVHNDDDVEGNNIVELNELNEDEKT
jgi:hypothetical protein